MHYDLDDSRFLKIREFLLTVKGIHAACKESLRKFINAIYYIARAGCQCRLLPSKYGHWRAIHKRFKNWVDQGIWEKLMIAMQHEPDLENIIIDLTIIGALACAAGYRNSSAQEQNLGRSKGGFSTKIHIKTDALGNPLKFLLTPGQQADITIAQELCADVKNANVIVDKAYTKDEFIDDLEAQGCTVVIPPKQNAKNPRDYDRHLYKERHVIECTIGKLKQFRKIATRSDKMSMVYLGFLCFVGAILWLR